MNTNIGRIINCSLCLYILGGLVPFWATADPSFIGIDRTLNANKGIVVNGTTYPASTEGLNAAFAAAGKLNGSRTVILRAIISVTSTVTIPSGVALQCDGGGGIRMADGAEMQVMIGVLSGTSQTIQNCVIDGNLTGNPGPYPTGESLIWIGDGASTAQTQKITIDRNTFLNCPRICVFVNSSYGVQIMNNRGWKVGGQFVHVDNSRVSTPVTDSQIQISGNQSTFDARVFVGTGILTQNSETIAGSGFSTNWGALGYDNVLVVQGQGNWTISSCNSGSCRLAAKFSGTTGSYPIAVGSDFAVQVIGAAAVRVEDNKFAGPDGSLEGIQFSASPNDPVNNSRILRNLVSYSSPRTVGAEGISYANLAEGGTGNNSTISNNTVAAPGSTCISVVPANFMIGTFYNNAVLNNTCQDANATAVLPPSGFDNGIRIGGANVDSTIVTNNTCISTRPKGLHPPRMGFNYCVGIDGPGNAATHTTVTGNSFRVVDRSGIVGLVRNRGANTRQ